MPITYARRLTGHERTPQANRQLSFALAFIAGAINAGGFLAVQQYTSHMTGIVSAMADNLVLGAPALVWTGVGALLFFVAGAACSAVMVNFARQRRLHSEYALPLLLEALLLLCFGLLGAWLSNIDGPFIPASMPVTVMLLCFIMGLQNAVITKLSRTEIRTTHITGVVTDIGIELGKLLYWNGASSPDRPAVLADRRRLKTLTVLALSFFVGGVVGALAFKQVGYLSTVPLAVLLIALAGVPAIDDLLALLQRRAGN